MQDAARSRAVPKLAPRPVETASLQSRAVDELRRMIGKGELLPGTALSEVALAESFGISRTPVREALKQLAVEGLVDIVPRVGTFVAQPSRREIVELFQVKEVLEGMAARLLALRGSVAELEALERNVRDSERSVEHGDSERYAQLVDEFHELIATAADNGKLLQLYRLLMNQLAYGRLVLQSLAQPGRPTRSVKEHREILELIMAKEGDGAEMAMREHVRSSARAVLMAMREPGGAADDGDRA